MGLIFDRHLQNETKIIYHRDKFFQVKSVVDGVTKNIRCDIRNIIDGITYHTERGVENNIPASNALHLNSIAYLLQNGSREFYAGRYDVHETRETRKTQTQLYLWDTPSDPSEYPIFLFLAEGETQTVETPDQIIVYPPPETVEQFFERIYARLLHLTRRIKVLRHEEPHQNALSTAICREVPADHEEVLRYDIACNLIKRPVGWLALQLENYQTRYNRHLAEVVKAKEAGRTPPTFNPGNDQTKIETMLVKLETHLTEDCLQEHFDMHDHGEWDKVQNKQRKITLCDDDLSPGEVLVDVNSFFTDGSGNVAETHAKRTYHEISTKYWVKAKRTPHRKLVTQRVVEIP